MSRMKASDEVGNKNKRKCTECNELGHTSKYGPGGPTAIQRRRLSSSEDASGESSNDHLSTHTANASGSTTTIFGGRTPTGRGRGRVRGRERTTITTNASACGMTNEFASGTTVGNENVRGRGRSGNTGGRLGAWFGL